MAHQSSKAWLLPLTFFQLITFAFHPLRFFQLKIFLDLTGVEKFHKFVVSLTLYFSKIPFYKLHSLNVDQPLDLEKSHLLEETLQFLHELLKESFFLLLRHDDLQFLHHLIKLNLVANQLNELVNEIVWFCHVHLSQR